MTQEDAKLVGLLNKAIARELQVSIQYMFQHSLGNALACVCQEMGASQELPTVLHLRVIEDSDLIKLFGAGQKDRWATRLPAYWLSMNEVVETLYPREADT